MAELSPNPRRPIGKGLPVAVVLIVSAVAGFGWLLMRAQELPTGVAPIAWDKEACAHCRMHVGEQAFASQLQLKDGRVLSFDDPGCLFSWLELNPAPVHATWLHHHTEDRWLSRDQAGFIETSPTPMGFGLAAVDAATAGSLTWDQASERLRMRKGATR
jgi:hypothetical protein